MKNKSSSEAMRNAFLQLRNRLLWLIILWGIANPLKSQTYDYRILMERVRTDVGIGIKDTKNLDNWVNTQSADGSWAVLSYGSLNAENAMNLTDNHVTRIWHLAAAATSKNHTKYGNNAYKQAVKKGLDYWYKSNTADPNWWYNWIYCPQKLGETLIFMREFEGYIPKHSNSGASETKMLSLFIPQDISQITQYGTGANAIDIALHFVYRGMLTENAALLENIRDLLTPILADNIQSDLVYQDHGPQIQISSYGSVFADGLIRLASYLSGTPAEFDIHSAEFARVIAFIRETQLASIRGNQWDFSVMGRQVSRINALSADLNYLQKMADFIDPEHAQVYHDAMLRMQNNQPANLNIRPQNKHYWSSDYTQHLRSDYLFAVRNVSTRTVEAETGNNENLKANYFSHGTNFISVDGCEYKNLMPYWDWCMIPGSTFAYTAQYPARPNWGANYGATSFVGGVSDGLYGASVLDMNKAGTKAKKSWFFFDDEIVCLGAGITDSSNREVRTTLNQAIMQQPSYTKEVGDSSENMQAVSGDTYSNSNLLYLRNGKIAYFFPQQGEVRYTMQTQKGSWKEININGSPDEVSGCVFSLWLNHGVNPSGSTYSYIVVPSTDSQDKAEAYDMASVEIIENTPSIQAVINKKLDILQVVFYEAGALTYENRKYIVNVPCILMVKHGTVVSLADPSQSKTAIEVTITVDNTSRRKSISLPKDKLKGSSVTVDFKK